MIFFVDDERTEMESYVIELEKSGHRVSFHDDVDDALAFFVREPFPSRSTDTGIREGRIATGDTLEIVSEMNSGGVIFGDGIEGDRLEFSWGRVARIALADFRLNLLAA